MKLWQWLVTIVLTIGAAILFGTSDIGGFVAVFLTCTVFLACLVIFVITDELRHERNMNNLQKMNDKQLYDRALYLTNKKRTKEEDEELEEINSIVQKRDVHDDNSNI